MQAWLTVAGLGLDVLGFVLLLREWWLAFFHEGTEIEASQLLERERKLRAFAQASAPPSLRQHMETGNRMREELAAGKARTALLATRRARRGTFVLAGVLIATGYLLQIAGALPL